MSTITYCPIADDHVPIGLVLSGGGARGAFQVGVWSVLRGHPDGLDGPPDVISGTSAGALNGSLIAAGLSPDEMLDFWLSLARKPPIKANREFFRSLQNAVLKVVAREPLRPLKRRKRSAKILYQIVRKHGWLGRGHWLAQGLEYMLTGRFDAVSDILDQIKTSYLFSTAPMRERLAEYIGGEQIRNPRCRLAINTVDVRTGAVVRFVTHGPRKHAEADISHYRVGPITIDMILASASIPLLFDPVRVDGMHLWDGGLLVNTPIAPTVALGAKRIIPVLVTSGRSAVSSSQMSLGNAVERLADAFLENAYNTDRKLLLERNKVAVAAPERNLIIIELFEAIRPSISRRFNAGSYLYFEEEAMLDMYEAGRIAAQGWLSRGPILDTHPGPRRAGDNLRVGHIKDKDDVSR